ncbi:hypothetical protein XENOCAPTIV_021052, partial [Xenoophorus captivus]
AQPVATLHATIPSTVYGKVHNVCIRQFGSKTMLHLHPAGETAICSMILCHRNETMLNELKSENEVSESTSVLGCSQTEYLLAAEAFCHSLELVATSLEHDGGTSLIDLTHAHHWTLPSDVTEEHLEGIMAPCGCGVVESCQNKTRSYLDTKYAGFSPAPLLTASPLQATVLDSFTAKVNALGVAVETANLVLDVRYVIQDVN